MVATKLLSNSNTFTAAETADATALSTAVAGLNTAIGAAATALAGAGGAALVGTAVGQTVEATLSTTARNVGLFTAASGSPSPVIPPNITLVETSGYSIPGVGAARYAQTTNTGATSYRFQSADRRWFEIIESAFSPEMFGTSSDWASALETCTLIAAGLPIIFSAGQSYTFNRAAVITKDIDIDLKGSTVIAPLGFISAVPRTSFTAGAYFNTVEGQRSFTIPGGVPITVGQWLILESNTVRVATGNYLYGEAVEVTSVSGGVATLREPFLNSYQVDRIRIQQLERVRIVNGKLDITGMGLQPTDTSAFSGITATARKIDIDLNIIGGIYSGSGVNVTGVFIDLKGSADGITNQQGFNSLTSGSRTGYGMSASGSYINVRGNFTNCKHGFSSADRQVMAKKLIFDNCSGSTPVGHHADTVTLGGGSIEPLYQGILDAHANVLDVVAIAPKLDGVNALMMLRGPKATIISPTLKSRGCVSLFRQNFLIYVAEDGSDRLTVTNAKASADTALTGAATPYLVGYSPDFVNSTYGTADIDGAVVNNVGLFSFESPAANQSIGNIRFGRISGSVIAGVIVGGTGQVLNSIGNIKILGDYTLTSPNYTLRPAHLVQNYTVCGDVEWGGIVNGVALTNTAPFIHNRTETLSSSGSGPNGKIDSSKLILKAYGRGIEIGSTSTTGADLMTLTGVVDYNVGNLTTASGIRIDISTAATRTAKFRGGSVRNNGQSTANTPAVQFLNVYSGNFSGLTINDALQPQSAAYVPSSIQIETITEIVWRSSSPSIYLSNSGNLTSDTVPTTNAFPFGTVVYNRSPAVGFPAYWMFTAGSSWRAGPNL